MTRLQTLIKEVLSQPKKKDCNCGCNDCGGKAPILTEGKVKHLISEGLQYHMDKKIQLHESVYRIGSEKHFELIREARALWVRGIINVSEDDQAILETHLGNFGMYEGEEVPLDMPMIDEGFKDYLGYSKPKMPSQEEVDEFFSITQNEMHYLNSKPVMGQEGDRVRSEIEPWDEYDLSNWNALVRKAKAQGKINEGFYSSPSDMDETGLNVRPKDQIHANMLKDALENSGLYAEWNAREGYFFFPEEQDLYDQLEMEIQDLMDENNIQGYIEGVFEESLKEAKKKAKSKKKDPPIGKPKRGGSKAYYVYVRDPKTKKIKKVSFGSGGLRAKIKNKKARNAFAARHKCKTATDRTTARYWSCRLPRYAKQLGLGSNMNTFW